MAGTEGRDYTQRLEDRAGKGWKQLLHAQAPYQWNLRRQHLGRTLDVGCGLGRNLGTLDPGSVGVDHNPDSVAVARAAGHTAYTVEEWQSCPERVPGAFDGMLVAHVIEHLEPEDGLALMRDYLPMVRPGGRVFLVCPQERGYASDATHVRWTTGEDLVALARECGLRPERPRSFPGPRMLGRVFTYNETTLLAHVPG